MCRLFALLVTCCLLVASARAAVLLELPPILPDYPDCESLHIASTHYCPQLIFDGLFNTFWYVPSSVTYLVLDFGSDVSLTEMRMRFDSSYGVSHVSLSAGATSSAAGPWASVANQSMAAISTMQEMKGFEATSQYWRLDFVASRSHARIRFYNLDVYRVGSPRNSRGEVLEDNPTVLWAMTEPPDDLSGNDNVLSVTVGSVALGSPGPYDGVPAMQLEGNGPLAASYICTLTSSQTLFPQTGGVVVEAWINPTQVTATSIIVHRLPWLLALYQGKLYFYVWSVSRVGSRTQGQYALSDTSVPLNAWTHVAGVWDGFNTISVYLNGTIDSSVHINSPTRPSNAYLRRYACLGHSRTYSNTDSGYQFFGRIAEVAAFISEPLPAARIEAHARNIVLPRVCLEVGRTPYNCHCHSCNCSQCPCSTCTVMTRNVSQCPRNYASCSSCYCAQQGCRCCQRICSRRCNCQRCCDTCYRTSCLSEAIYDVTSVEPSTVQYGRASPVLLKGATFVNTQRIVCRFGAAGSPSAVIVAGEFVDSNTIRCLAPATIATSAGSTVSSVPVALSLDNGTDWTADHVSLGFLRCGNDTSACNARGTCGLDGVCICSAGYWGPSCESECPGGASNPCNGRSLVGGSCDSSGVCHCSTGSFGNACQQTCPGLGSSVCSGRGICNAQTNGTCVCNSGFTGEACNQTTTGSNNTCPSGFWGLPNCGNKCPGGSSNPCSSQGECSPVTGECISCNRGYWGVECSQQCPGTAADPCSGRGLLTDSTCDHTTGRCYCKEGYFGAACERSCPLGNVSISNTMEPCSGRGQCTAGGVCQCPAGFLGASCELECPTHAGSVCNGKGTCELTGASATCLCNDGSTGAACEIQCSAGANGLSCSGFGNCIAGGVCSCSGGHFGPTCSGVCPGGSSVCSGNGICSHADGTCSCDSGYFGVACELTCPGGASNPCWGNGTCTANSSSAGGFTCHCNPGYAGVDCLTPECEFDCGGPSQGTCVEGVCQCVEGFEGKFCETESGSTSSPLHGVLNFFQQQLEIDEEAGTLFLRVNRDGPAVGNVSVEVDTTSLSALHGDGSLGGGDFFVSTDRLAWGDGDNTPKYVTVDIIQDDTSEGDEEFLITLHTPAGGAMVGDNSTITLRIRSNTGNELVVEVTLRLLLDINSIPASSQERFHFVDTFQDEVSQVLGAPDGVVRVADLRSVGAQMTLIHLDFFPVSESASDKEAVLTMADRLVREVANPSSALYAGNTTGMIDITYMPIVSSRSTTNADDTGSKNNLPLIIGVSVGVGVCLIACVVCCYRKRSAIVDWSLWKLGSMRFRTLMENSDSNSVNGSSDMEGPTLEITD